MHKVVVSGCTGWIGHHVVLDLSKYGCDCIPASRGRKSKEYAVGLGDTRRNRLFLRAEVQIKGSFS